MDIQGGLIKNTYGYTGGKQKFADIQGSMTQKKDILNRGQIIFWKNPISSKEIFFKKNYFEKRKFFNTWYYLHMNHEVEGCFCITKQISFIKKLNFMGHQYFKSRKS